MNDINFDITKHWLPIGEKQGSIEKDTLRIKGVWHKFSHKT